MQNPQNSEPKQHDPSSTPQSERYVIGIDIGGTSLRVALADAGGNILAKWSASTIGIRDAHLVVDLIARGTDELLLETSVPRSLLRAAAAGAPGMTDVDRGVVIATSYLMGWRDVPLREMLTSALQVVATIDNDVNLGALGEYHCGAAQHIPDFVFLALGTGLGAGIMLNGQLLRGRDWSAGEIGYMLVPGTSLEPAAEGEPGALEKMVGGEGIRSQWQAGWNDASTKLPRNLMATEILSHATAGNRLAMRILDQSARMLAYAIYNMSLVLNCPLFVLGGSVGLHPALLNAVQALLNERSAYGSVQLMPSRLGPDAQLIGAIQLAMRSSMEPGGK